MIEFEAVEIEAAKPESKSLIIEQELGPPVTEDKTVSNIPQSFVFSSSMSVALPPSTVSESTPNVATGFLPKAFDAPKKTVWK